MPTHADSNLTATQASTFAAAFHRVDPTRVGRTVATGGFGWSKDRQSIVIPSAESRAAFVRFRSGRLQVPVTVGQPPVRRATSAT